MKIRQQLSKASKYCSSMDYKSQSKYTSLQAVKMWSEQGSVGFKENNIVNSKQGNIHACVYINHKIAGKQRFKIMHSYCTMYRVHWGLSSEQNISN